MLGRKRTSSFLLFVLLFSFTYSQEEEQKSKQSHNGTPNIIWIMAEDISTDAEVYGMKGVQTPNLNRLAEQGILYTNAFCTSPICSPNRSAMIVGAHQNMIGAEHHRSNRNRPLPQPYKPITWWLRKAGYTNILGHHGVRGNGRKIDVNFKHSQLGTYNGETKFGLFDKLDTLDTADQPFFAQITLAVTHRGDWWEQVRNESPNPVNPDSVVLPPYLADHTIIRQEWARYLDQIEYMDREVGMIMDELEEERIDDNTVIIFIGDNGRANIRGKGYLYDPGLRIPLIVRWPQKIKGGQISDQLVSTTDISASVLDLAGVSLPDYLTGKSFINTESNREAVYSARDLWDEVMEKSRSVITQRYKYIRHEMSWVPLDAGQAYLEFYRPAIHVMRSLYQQGGLDSIQASFFYGTKPKEELYDRQDDPFETRNLAGNVLYQDRLKDLQSILGKWEAQLPRSQPSDHILVKPIAPELLEWVKYERSNQYFRMLEGVEIGFQKLLKEYRSLQK